MVFLKPIFFNDQQLSLIVVTKPLRRKFFRHFHTGPTGSHMGKYKTLYRMRLWFFWPGLRTDLTAWDRGCAHCLSYNVWRNQKQELHFSWPVTIPFYIMHVNLWDAGTSLSKKSASRHILNAMCDLSQFVVYTITTKTYVEHLMKLSMVLSCT